MTDVLSVSELRTYFFLSKGVVKAVDDVSLKVREREIVGIVGESGCGKSTMAFSILRLIPKPPGRIVGGEIRFKDTDLLALSDEGIRAIRGGEIAMIFQDPMSHLNPLMKVGDQIGETFLYHGIATSNDVKDKVVRVLEMVRIPSARTIMEAYPHQLSGGMRQRVLIAMAISCNPSLLIADEPTSALDATIQLQIINLIRTLRGELGSSVLLITHDLGIVAEICDRVYVMYAGRIVEVSDVLSLYAHPKHPYTVALMQSVLRIDERKNAVKYAGLGGMVPDLMNPPTGCRFHPRCLHATQKCKVEEPPLIPIEREYEVRCWLYE